MTEYIEKRIGLISNLRVGLSDRGLFQIAFSVMISESAGCNLSVTGDDAVRAIVESGYEDISNCKACYVKSLEKDGNFGCSSMMGFAGFVKVG